MDITILATGLKFPEGPVILRDGSVVVVEVAGGTVTRIAPDGTSRSLSRTGGGPNGLATGPDGMLYLCNNGGNAYAGGDFISTGPAPDYAGGSIQRIHPETGETTTLYTHCGPRRLSAPNDLVFDRAGGFYFTDIGKRHPEHRDNGALYYALPDGSRITAVVFPMLTPNGVGLSPDERTLYVADTETSRLVAFEILSPGVVKHDPFPSYHGGRVICGLPGYQRFDSLALEANGNICVATLMAGEITVISPVGEVVRRVTTSDVFPTNICFGGPDLRTAYVTLSASGRLACMPWPEPGLRPNFSAFPAPP